MSRGPIDPEANELLGSLPFREQRRLLPALTTAPLGAHEVLYEPGRPIDYLYFPKRGTIVSLDLILNDGRCFSAGLVGNEGAVGAEAFLGGGTAQFTAVVLSPGESLRVGAGFFQAAVRGDGPLVARLRRYAQFLLLTFAQVAGCNRFHTLEQHFSSLLLRLQDRSGCADFAITHELFARLMGVRRVGVSQVARKLQRAGLIRYRWGKVALLDRPGLEARACVCHRQIEEANRSLLGPCEPAR